MVSPVIVNLYESPIESVTLQPLAAAHNSDLALYEIRMRVFMSWRFDQSHPIKHMPAVTPRQRRQTVPRESDCCLVENDADFA